MPTPHFRRVREFMQKVGQATPQGAVIPDEDVRVLRAKLILEEALETVEAMGVTVRAGGEDGPVLDDDSFHYEANGVVDLIEVADGCADISVVTIGTLIAFGIDDEPLLEEVDASNLRKFGEGSYRREDGKWIKPPDWHPPNIDGAIERGFGRAGDTDRAGVDASDDTTAGRAEAHQRAERRTEHHEHE